MAFTVSFPAQIPASQSAFTIDTKTLGALAQVSGSAVGFDLFTPTANCTYLLAIRVQDAATGAPTNCTTDLVVVTTVGTWVPTKMAASVTTGTCATTYSKNSSALKLAVATGTTWYVDVVILARFPA